MAITFLENRKKQRYLILALLFMLLATSLVIWLGFLREEKTASPLPPEIIRPAKAEINWQVLEDERLRGLEPFGQIIPFEGELGRENPFLPY